MIRFMIELKEDERRGLVDLAKRERREPRDQAAVLIRERLRDLGVLQANRPTQQPQPAAEATK